MYEETFFDAIKGIQKTFVKIHLNVFFCLLKIFQKITEEEKFQKKLMK